MTESRAGRRPSPRVVLWGSAALFATLLALLTFQLGSGGAGGVQTATRPVEVRKVIVRRVVTTVVPAPGEGAAPAETVTSGPVSTLASAPAPAPEAAPEPVEPVTTGAS